MDSSVSHERRNLVSARVPSYFKRSLTPPERRRYRRGGDLKSRKLLLLVAILYLDVIAGTFQLLLNKLI